MFFEIDPDLLKQEDQPLTKRWFRDPVTGCDLLVWGDDICELKRFQFWHQQALLEWNRDGGIKTGYVNAANGAFRHYQSELYRLHRDLDSEILAFVTDLIHKNISQEGELISKIFLILNDISSHN